MISTNVIRFSVFLLFFYLSTVVIYGQQITTKQGDIKGIKKSTINGREVHAYLGIPYAQPPVGELRFQNPVAFGSWTGVRDASKDGSKCLQGLFIFGANETIGSEDCLFLNVYVPARIPKGKKLPVMFYIHGGGFEAGDGTSSSVGPDYLLDKDIILVTINYRLGPLGFASTEDAEMPGNYGLKDQVLALKWVQQYIADYGGNPDSVTIFGESAGGASVHYLMISPLAKGLFHRAIAMSGTSHCPWAIRAKGVSTQRTKKLASLVGCPSEPSKFLLDCLQQISPVLFLEMLPKYQIWEKDPMVIFPPVIEPKGTEGAFLTEHPINIKTSIPMMTGVTKDEGAMRIGLFYLGGTLEQRLLELEERFSEIGPLTLMIDDTVKKPVEFAENVRNFYFGKNKIGIDSIQSLINMYTDSWFFHCTTSAIRMHTGPAYLYLFAHRGKHSLTDELTKSNVDYGVCHADDLQYLLVSKKYQDSEQVHQGDDKKMVNTMVDLWTNFTIHGNPTPEGSKVNWDKTSPAEMNYFRIEGGALKMEKHLFSERDQFWKNLYKSFNPVSRKSVNKGGEL